MYKCCIFDLDGTLVNSIYALQRSVNLTLEHFGLGPVTVEATKLYVGDGYKKLIERALIACGDEKLRFYDKALELYADIFKGCCLYRVEAYDGILELITFLRENKIKTAVLSNKPHPRTLDNVDGVFGAGRFDLIYGEREELGIKKKPAPDGVEAILKELGIKPSECLYLGDTNTDMLTGQNAGADTVGVTWGFRTREELSEYHPRLLADHPSDVMEFVKGVNHIE